MKLHDYVERQSGAAAAPGLYGYDRILGFVFGEKYQIITGLRTEFNKGIQIEQVFEFDNLVDILSILHAEFDPRTDEVPEMIITSSRDLDRTMGLPHGTAIGPSSARAAAAAQALGATPQTPGLGMKGTAEDRLLLVRAAPASPAFERPPMECYIDMFRTEITKYNLTQSWDQMEGRANL